jgi:hypothetical protein
MSNITHIMSAVVDSLVYVTGCLSNTIQALKFEHGDIVPQNYCS